MVCQLAREGGEVVHKVIRDILQHLRAQKAWVCIAKSSMWSCRDVACIVLTNLNSVGLELQLRVDGLREVLQPRRREVVAAVRHGRAQQTPSYAKVGPPCDGRGRGASSSIRRMASLLGFFSLLLASAEALTLPAAAFRSAATVARAPCVVAQAPPDDGAGSSAPLETFDDAEARGMQLFSAGEYERAIRMFELAQTLPGDGVDLKRVKQGGMIGSATAPPNPREWAENRFATAEQKLIASYNIACCYAAMGDKPRAMELLRAYAAKVGEPLNQVNEMLVDSDLVAVRDELRALREEYKGSEGGGGLFGLSFKNPLKDAAESIGVEWKD